MTLQPAMTSESLALLKDLLKAGDFVTPLPLLGVCKEVSLSKLVAVLLNGPLLQDTAVQVISRLGHQLLDGGAQAC